MILRRDFLGFVSLAGVVGCSRGPAPVAAGSRNTTEQAVLAEIAAQHVERRLGRAVQRRLRLGGSMIVYQSFQSSEISFYPESAGSILTEILHEAPSSDPAIVLERVRGEMRRTAQADLLDPLGVRPDVVGVIRSNDPRAAAASTLGEAAAVKDGWKVAVSYEFQQRSDGIPALTQYRLPMAAPVRALDPALLFKTLEEGQVSMVVTTVTDGALESGRWKALRDDRNLFTPQQTCFLVRQASLDAEPKLRPALAELSGKLTNEAMRRMNSLVDFGNKPVPEVAGDFLKAGGLA